MTLLAAALRGRDAVREVRAVVEGRLLEDPRFLTRHDRIGWTVLHRAACRFAPEAGLLAYLVQKSPESIRIRTKNNDGAMALHLYVSCKSYGRNLEGTRILVNAWPAALLEATADGSTPLHLALQMRTYVRAAAAGRGPVPGPTSTGGARRPRTREGGSRSTACGCGATTRRWIRSEPSRNHTRRRSSRGTAAGASRSTSSPNSHGNARSFATWRPSARGRSAK
jgi:hypothetical protein